MVENSEGLNLSDLEQGFLKSADWKQLGCLVLQIEDASGERQFEVTFSGIKFLKVLASSSPNSNIDNEIWKMEEVLNSSLTGEAFEKDGIHWLSQTFGDKYQRTSSVKELDHLHHVVLLSDYLDLDFLCDRYVIMSLVPVTHR